MINEKTQKKEVNTGNGVGNLEDQVRTTYSFDEAVKISTEYFNGDEMAATNFVNKYALKDSHGNIYESSPDQMHHRIASEVARVEEKYPNPMSEKEIYSLLKGFNHIVPQGGPMTGIGNDYQIASLSNCFVIGNNSDSYGGIMKTDEEQVQLMKRRGGVGHDLSHIRPAGSPVNNSALTSTGVVPFMERYSNSTREVAQDGRRGALMLSVSSKHPDAQGFIDAKLDGTKVTGANVSVRIDDEFMNAALEDRLYTQQFPIGSDNPSVKKEVNAKDMWDKIVHNAWKKAEPGILFWDTVIKESVPDCYDDLGFKTVSTNPCGEIPLCPYDSCRLLAVNLYGYVKDPFTDKAEFDFEKFKEHAGHAQRIMDDIIDLELEKIDTILEKVKSKDVEYESIKSTEIELWKNIREKCVEGRRTGVGVTAEGDMLAALGMTYGSNEAIEFSTNVHKTFAVEAYRSSVKMAKERGSFPIYDAEREKDNPMINRIKEADPELYKDMAEHGRRNIALLTIAPTGTTSQMTQTTSGIEPVFLPAYTRRRKINPNDRNTRTDFVDEVGDHWQEYNVFHHKFEDWLKINGHDVEKVKNYTKEELDEIVKKSPYHGATANDVDWVAKVKMQGEIQKWVDHSISVTVNLPEDISEEMVGKVYEEAWRAGCKGVTVYRDGSRSGVLLTGNENLEDKVTLVQKNIEKPHPKLEIKAQTIKYKIKRQNQDDSLHVILASDLYVDDENKKAYFIPDEDFQVRAPLGAPASTSFAQSGMDRTQILRGPNPDYAEFVTRLRSAFSNEDEGRGPARIKSIEDAAGIIIEDYLTRNGVIKRDPQTSQLVNLVRKADLRKVERGTEEYNQIISQVRIGEEEDELELSLDENLGDCDICSQPFRMVEGCKACGCGSKCE